MLLSLCIATYNEESNLHYPLDSAYDFVDEVIIVDGRSTDKTIEIAKSYGDKIKIIQTDNPPMFHINKQKALDAAKGEWILQLDADEALTDELKEEIKLIINSKFQFLNSKQYQNINEQNPKQNRLKNLKLKHLESFRASDFDVRISKKIAYNLPRKNWFLNRFLMKGGQYPDYTIRLYRNGAVRFPCKDVHENVELINPKSQNPKTNQLQNLNNKNVKQLEFNNLNLIRNLKFEIGYLNSPILHYSDPTFKRYWARWKRYTKLEAEKIKNKNEKIKMVDYLILKPISTFFLMYFRHKGFMDGWAGFVFAFFSSIRFIRIYLQYKKLAD